MHVAVVGDGPPLLLLHGWAMHGGVFAPLVDRLRDRYRLHLVDLPGHGHSRDSGVPLTLDACVEAIIDQVPVAAWCGWSLGGLVALKAATAHPDRVSALAMLCASPRFVREEADVASAAGTPGRWRWGMSAEIFDDFAAGLRDDWRATLDRFIALEALGSSDARGELRALRAALFARGEPAAAVLADGLDLLKTSDLRACLPALSVPNLWIAGRRDRLVDPRALRAAAACAKQSQCVSIELGAHAPFLTHADEVAGLLHQFFDSAAVISSNTGSQ
ncbi:MAG: pimeloyl-ACP methyl ester esterase BioH [Luteimonas sp.]